MPIVPIIMLIIYFAAIVAFGFAGFWMIERAKLPDPFSLIARVIVLIIALALLIGLFVPSLGIGLSLGG